MTGRVAEWPVAIVTGLLGAGKTTLISRLLLHPAMADTLVLVNEFGEVGLDHDLIRSVSDNVVLLPNGCLCCTIRQDIVQTLRELRRGWLAGSLPDFGRVLIETTGLAEPAPLVASIAAHPLLADYFILRSISTVVDGQQGWEGLLRTPTGRNQVSMADHLMISKGDLIRADAAAELGERLTTLNRLATIGPSHSAEPGLLFGRTSTMPRHRAYCDEASDHLAGIRTIVVKPEPGLRWSAFRVWLAQLLEESGSQLLRVKGRLRFDDLPDPMIVQAVRHIFYPLVAAPASGDRDEVFLVLIFEGPVPDEIAQRIGAFGLGVSS